MQLSYFFQYGIYFVSESSKAVILFLYVQLKLHTYRTYVQNTHETIQSNLLSHIY